MTVCPPEMDSYCLLTLQKALSFGARCSRKPMLSMDCSTYLLLRSNVNAEKMCNILLVHLLISLCAWQGEWLLWGPVRRKHCWGLWGFHRRHRRRIPFRQGSTKPLPYHAESPASGFTDGLLSWCKSYFHTDLHANLPKKRTSSSNNVTRLNCLFLVLPDHQCQWHRGNDSSQTYQRTCILNHWCRRGT